LTGYLCSPTDFIQPSGDHAQIVKHLSFDSTPVVTAEPEHIGRVIRSEGRDASPALVPLSELLGNAELAVYERLRRQGNLKEALLCAWGICRDGRKVLLHMALGNKESLPAWREFIHHMVKRGLPTPTLVTTDGAPALIAAVEEAWPQSLRQRCVMHKTRNILDKVPPSAQLEIKQRLQAIWNAPNRATADLLLQDFIATYEPVYPSAVACLLDDLEASLAFLRCPPLHHRRIRTTNLRARLRRATTPHQDHPALPG